MNYKHAYHAGNHAEVFKHSALCLLLLALRRKPKPFTVLDTHAGAGMYDLDALEPQKTGEALDGIGRVIEKDIRSASAYLDIVRRLNPVHLRYYPGSPTLVRALLRANDRLIACELRDDDAALLHDNFKKDPQVSIHHRDGYEAIGAFVPLRTRRGLVFIDPSFERANDLERLGDTLNSGIKKWPSGIFMAWYPIKGTAVARELRRRLLSTSPPTLCCELFQEPPEDASLSGSGIIICNPPWQFDHQLKALCRELISAFEAARGSFHLEWWIRQTT
jgi:23S rRNA (adenine2030-N6)-methyltransferase